jgi:hypothetical protein
MVSEMLQHPLPPVKLAAPTVPDVDGIEDEQAVLPEEGAPPPPLFDAAVPPDAVALLLPDDEPPDADEEPLPDDRADCAVPPPA